MAGPRDWWNEELDLQAEEAAERRAFDHPTISNLKTYETNLLKSEFSPVSSSYSNIRERLLEQQASRADELASNREFVFQAARTARVHPSVIVNNIRAVGSRLRDEIVVVRRLNEAGRKSAEAYNALSPLEQVARNENKLRRNHKAAIEGILKRHQDEVRKMSRREFDARAKALAASRRRQKLSRYMSGKKERPSVNKVVDATLAEKDPCFGFHERQRARRESMFARKLMNLHGHTSYRERKDRRDVKEFLLRC